MLEKQVRRGGGMMSHSMCTVVLFLKGRAISGDLGALNLTYPTVEVVKVDFPSLSLSLGTYSTYI